MIIEIDEVNLDIESRSELDLPTVGLDRYVNHESTEIVMVAWQVNEGPLEQWDLSQGPPPARLIAKYAGYLIDQDGKQYRLINDKDIAAVERG